jgi:putative PEP-CTERM system histidine kinase
MIITVFIYASGLVNLILICFLFFKNEKKRSLVSAVILSFLLPALAMCGYHIFPLMIESVFWVKLFSSLSFIIAVFLIEMVKSFLRFQIEANHSYKISKIINSALVCQIAGICAAAACFSLSWATPAFVDPNEFFIVNNFGSGLLYVQLVMEVYILYSLENIYRFATPHQRRVGRIFFLAFFTMVLFQIVFLARGLLYKTIIHPYIDASIVLNGICFPILLLGLFRFRIGSYEVAVSRQAIYSSISLFAFGSFFLGLGLASFFAQRFGFSVSFFEIFLPVFSVSFFAILAISSEGMRSRIRAFANKHVFRRKFDYREQFFWLHQSYMAGDDLEESVSILSENLQYTLNCDKVLIFLLNAADGKYYLHVAPESTEAKEVLIPGDSAVISAFASDKHPLDFGRRALQPREQEVVSAHREIIERFGITAIFPIFHQGSMLGLLCIKHRKNEMLDEEDKMLISVFTVSIGNVYFKYRMLKERIEHKQFESFNHMASFLVHDIKNQVATLSLVIKNADKNIHIPSFQQSLIKSVKSCTAGLQALIDKLTAPPKLERLSLQTEDINTIILDAVSATGVRTLDAVHLKTDLLADQRVVLDRTSFYYIIKNLIINALEAMNKRGTLTIRTDAPTRVTEEFLREFTITEQLLRTHHVCIVVEDTGVGMSKEFLQEKLYHPFSSTKDKGIGIGLYQCKTLLEEMNGKLLCVSYLNVGTKFCILL